MTDGRLTPEEVAQVIEAFRIHFGMTQADIARDLGMVRESVTHWKARGVRKVVAMALRMLWEDRAEAARMAGRLLPW